MVVHADTRQFAFGSLSEALDIVVAWVEAMHGRGGTSPSLLRILGLVNARSASLVRLQLDTATETALDRAERAGVPAPRTAGLSFPQYLLGHGLGQAQQGTVWYASDLSREIAADERGGAPLCMPDDRTREIA